MVKIAIAGGTGREFDSDTLCRWLGFTDDPPEVAREVIDALDASGKHDIVILSRSVSFC